MKLTLGRKILIGFIACALVLFGVAIFSYKNSEKFIASNAWVDHTTPCIE
jgi:CHASE3 domain sensor protein